jgi:FixJ family two-component response regulator
MDISGCVHAAIGMPVGEIIIIDDNEDWRDSLAAILELEGYVVTGFPDGKSFLDEAAERTPICIFLDVFMPGLSGLEVLERLAENAYRAPIFLISARIDAPVVLEALRNGVLGVIEKPFDSRTAVLRVRQAANLRAQYAESKRPHRLSGYRFVGDARLTTEECGMLKEIAAGTSNEAAAAHLGISPRAAAQCRADVRRKLGARRFAELMGIGIAGGRA